MRVALADEPCTLHVALAHPGRAHGWAVDQGAAAALAEVLATITPHVEMIGADQAFAHLAGARRLYGPPPRIAALVHARVHQRTGAGCAVGLARTATLARLASAQTGDGVMVVTDAAAGAFLAPLPLAALPGVGPATAAHLARLGVRRVVDLQAVAPSVVVRVLGRGPAEHLLSVAAGADPPPRPRRRAPGPSAGAGVGGDHVFDRDVVDEGAVLRAVLALCARAAADLRAQASAGLTVTLGVHLADGAALTRRTTLVEPADLTAPLMSAATAAWARLGLQRARVRALSVRVSALIPAAHAHHQPQLGEREVGWAQGERAADAARARFGPRAVHPASLLASPPRPAHRQHDGATGPARGDVADPSRLRAGTGLPA